jgi:hypothetical protein
VVRGEEGRGDASMNEVCPSCGSFTDYLGEVTGWCHECEAINGTADAKECLGCGVWKTLEDFPTHRRSQDGHRGKCRTCTSAQRQANREANRERENANWRRYYHRKAARRLEVAS